MKKSILIAASTAVMALATPQAFAQAKSFEGFSVGLNYSSVRTEQTLTTPTTGISSSVSDGYSNLQAEYIFAINESYVFGIGGTFGLSPLKGATWPSSETFAKDIYTVDFQPGYAVSSTTLLYGRLSYSSSTGYSSNGTTTSTADASGYGFGVRQLLTPKFYVQADYTRQKLNERTTGTTVGNGTSNALSLGIGYQF